MTWSKAIAFPEPVKDVRLWRLDRLEDVSGCLQDQARTAFQSGVLDGERRLSEQLLRQRAELVELQNGVLAALKLAVNQVIDQSERQVVELALEVAQKVIGEVPINVELVEANVRAALAQAREATEVRIRLHPDDLGLLQQAGCNLLTPADDGRQLHFQASNEVGRGGCVVETRLGVMDATRETRLAGIRKALNP